MIFLALLDTKEEQDKFEAIVEKYKHRMFHTVKKVIKDEHLAEDVMQDVFMKIVNKIDQIDDIDSLETKIFLLTVAKRTALDYYRKNSKIRKAELLVKEAESEVFYNIEEAVISKLNSENQVIALIKSMKEDYRDVFLMKYVKGLENKEIAELFGIKEETVRQRISRGKKMLEEKLESIGK